MKGDHMTYQTYILPHPDGIEDCPVFKLDQFQWRCMRTPQTTGRMCFVPKSGLYVRMRCDEANPRRIYHKDNDPVYLDSAVEVFLSFSGKDSPPCYINLEVNANGALLAQLGTNRTERQLLPAALYTSIRIHTDIYTTFWHTDIHIPKQTIEAVWGAQCWKPGLQFGCNFYKISETPDIEHYASFNRIHSDVPDFHRPDCFAKAILCSPSSPSSPSSHSFLQR